jgi:antitoxin CptB
MSKEHQIKQLLYRSIHRGCKETDFLIGEFAKEKLDQVEDLDLYSKFIEEDDAEIYDWILKKSEAPKQYSKLLVEIAKFHKI